MYIPSSVSFPTVKKVIRTRNVRVLPDVTEEFGHEGNTKAANLLVGFTLGVKV